MTDQNYPDLFKRVKAIISDFFILLVIMIVVVLVFATFENVPDYVRGIAFLFVFVFYDPIFVSAFGGTIGHKLNGLSVKEDKNRNLNILFHLALVRFIVKTFLGWLSLLTVTGNEKKKAIHDMMVGSIVLYKG